MSDAVYATGFALLTAARARTRKTTKARKNERVRAVRGANIGTQLIRTLRIQSISIRLLDVHRTRMRPMPKTVGVHQRADLDCDWNTSERIECIRSHISTEREAWKKISTNVKQKTLSVQEYTRREKLFSSFPPFIPFFLPLPLYIVIIFSKVYLLTLRLNAASVEKFDS